jgi:hypothetical protein
MMRSYNLAKRPLRKLALWRVRAIEHVDFRFPAHVALPFSLAIAR